MGDVVSSVGIGINFDTAAADSIGYRALTVDVNFQEKYFSIREIFFQGSHQDLECIVKCCH